MLTCASCGHELPEGAKFCLECGAPVAPAAPPREQRKSVTVLFCDVAGSTEEARPLCEQKGHTVGIARVEEMRAELVATMT